MEFGPRQDENIINSRSGLCEPKDRFYLIYIAFYLLGMTPVLPGSFFITAEDYWKYKFRNVSSNSTTEITPLQAAFASNLSVSATIPSTLFLILNAIYGHKIKLNVRMLLSLFIILVIFVINTALIKVNTDQWQMTMYYIMIVSVIIMASGTSLMSGGLFGMAGQFPSKYVTAVVSGQALGSVFVAITKIIIITIAPDPRSSAIIFFMIGNGILIVSLIAWIIVSKTEFFNFYINKKSELISEKKLSQVQHQISTNDPVLRDVLNKMWIYGFSVWMIFLVTLSLYPAVTVLINSENHGNGNAWNDIYFIPVTSFLIYNSVDYFGRQMAGFIRWPNNKPHILSIFAVMRIIFVPAILSCNTNPRHHLPVFIHSDYIFIIVMCFFAFSNGYLENMAMIWAPRSVVLHEKEMASALMGAFLGVGMASGSTLSLFYVQLL